MNQEQTEAKSLNIYTIFTNTCCQTMKDLHFATKGKTGQELADAIHACLLDCLSAASIIGKDKRNLLKESAFTNTEAQTIVTQAMLFAFTKYGPLPNAHMEYLLQGASTCIEELTKEYEKQGIPCNISPEFHVILSEEGKPCLGIIDKNKPTHDDDSSTY